MTLKEIYNGNCISSKVVENMNNYTATFIEVRMNIPYFDNKEYLNEINRHLKGIQVAIDRFKK